jgi:hypothetical protein
VYPALAAGVLNLGNTIVAGNTSASEPDVFGTFTSLGHNLIGATDGSSGWVGSDLTGTAAAPLDPLLGPQQDNGGSTQTMALLPGSPAIDAGSNALVPAGVTTDQRGSARILGPKADIGAYEATSKRLEASASSQGTINLGSNGAIVLHLAINAQQLSGTDTVASLFNGATFTIAIQQADGSMTFGTLTATAQAQGDGSITVSMQMNDTLRAELYDAYVNGRAVNFNMTATANDGYYYIDADTMSRLLNNGALRYVP